MKKYIILLLILLGVVLVLHNINHRQLETLPLSEPTPVELFIDKIAVIEGDDYEAVNRHGMVGRYQFSPTTLKWLGFDVDIDEFKMNPTLQDSAMIVYMKKNYEQLAYLIDQYYGEELNGVKITPATVLAGAHFAGSTGVTNYILNGDIRTDSNGMSIVRYMKKFNNFHLPMGES